MALHEQSVGATYTPRHIFTPLGCTFDVDVASPGQGVTPWIPAKAFITSNSLQRPLVSATDTNARDWRQAAADYHHARGRQTLVVEIDPERLARLRRLMADDVSLEPAWHALRDKRSDFQKVDFR